MSSPTTPLTRWFAANARALPWRTTPRDPYHTLVAEAMLQQTQVSRVADRFVAFIQRFPTVHHLAAADLADALALWSGLGYYRRARHLHAAARAIVADHAGRIPSDVPTLLTLPGVGRYTAGAIASIAFGRRAPLVDGNVARVLMRLDAHSAPHTAVGANDWAWSRAERLVVAAADPAALNEGLMELGATICTPRNPRCELCPLRTHCKARRAGTQDRIPAPPPPRAAPKPGLFCASIIPAGARTRLLVQRRPDTGMWPGLWQAPTLERTDRPPTRTQIARWLGFPTAGAPALARVDSFVQQTTHRAVRFDVWRCRLSGRTPRSARWIPRADAAHLGLSNPQRRILLGHAPAPAGTAHPRRLSSPP